MINTYKLSIFIFTFIYGTAANSQQSNKFDLDCKITERSGKGFTFNRMIEENILTHKISIDLRNMLYCDLNPKCIAKVKIQKIDDNFITLYEYEDGKSNGRQVINRITGGYFEYSKLEYGDYYVKKGICIKLPFTEFPIQKF